jgi:hypothetical protein
MMFSYGRLNVDGIIIAPGRRRALDAAQAAKTP